jgi:3-methyladenine DNA glycosylase AlkC
LIKMPPGKTAEQVEQWSLHRGVNLTALTDDAIDAAILPLLREDASAK